MRGGPPLALFASLPAGDIFHHRLELHASASGVCVESITFISASVCFISTPTIATFGAEAAYAGAPHSGTSAPDAILFLELKGR
jgi:hypothetical protein